MAFNLALMWRSTTVKVFLVDGAESKEDAPCARPAVVVRMCHFPYSGANTQKC
jgi:hypothetical protein